MEKFDNRKISADQSGELTKQFLKELWHRNHAEGCALLGKNAEWHIKEFLDELGDFNCDWVASDLVYPKTYKGLRPVDEQINLVADEFRLDRTSALKLLSRGLPDAPKWAEGWAALPILEKLRGDYVSNVEKALTWHSGVCGNAPDHYADTRAERLTLEDLRPHYVGKEIEQRTCSRSRFAIEWEEQVGGRIMLVPVQMGAMRRGQSDRMVRAYCSQKNKSEFPLGNFEMTCLLAMHPGRVPYHEEAALDVNAPGDVFTPEVSIKSSNCRWKQMGSFVRFERAGLPYFHFGSDRLQSERHGPITASSWDIKAHLGRS